VLDVTPEGRHLHLLKRREGWAIVIQGAGLLISRGMNGTNAAQYTAPLRFAMVEWIRGIYGITYSPEVGVGTA